MRVLGIKALILVILFLVVSVSYAQIAEEYYNKGLEYATQGEFEKAREEFKKGLEIDQFYEPAKEYLKLIEDVLEERVEDEAVIHLFKGTTYHNKGMWNEAIAEYKKALIINPNDAKAHTNLGVAYEAIDEPERAVKEYELTIECTPNHFEAISNLEALSYDMSKLMQAAKDEEE